MRTTIPQPPPPPPPPPSTTTTAATTTAPTITTCPSTSPHATRAAHLTGVTSTSLHLASPTDHQPIDLLVRLGVTLPNALLLPYRPIPPARVAPDHSSLYLPLAPCTPLYTHLRNISRAPYFHRRPDLAGHLITATTDLTRVTAVLSPPIPE